MKYRIIGFLVVVLLSYLLSGTKQQARQLDPHLEVRPRIFREDESSAASASSSDDEQASGSAMTTHPEASYTCACGPLCTCHIPPDLPVAASAESMEMFDLQAELVDKLCRIEELEQEIAALKAAAQPKAVVQYYYPPARSTYGNSYNQGSNCGPNGCYYPARGGFFRRR